MSNSLIDRLEASEQENAKLRGSLVTLGVSYELDRDDGKPTYYQWQGKLYAVNPAALKASSHQENCPKGFRPLDDVLAEFSSHQEDEIK
jgi:hypothetical protein